MRMSMAEYLAHEERMAARTRKNVRAAESAEPPSDSKCERDLHMRILADCKNRGWIALHGSMAEATARVLGEWDFTILAAGGGVIFIECKTKTGKLSTAQQGMILWAEKLGHKIHVVRSFEQYLNIVSRKEP